MRWLRIWVMVAALTGFGIAAWGQVALDNSSVIKMTKSGMGEALILSVVQGQPGTYDTSVDGMVALKEAGVTDRVIAAMTAKGPAVTVNDYDGLDVGVYYKTREVTEWKEVPTEPVYARSGGAFKSLATHGIIKEDMNGRLMGAKSKLELTTPLTFLIVTPSGVDATDFVLVDLTEKRDAREFRTKTGGVFHTTEDVSHNAVGFEGKKLARHTYEVDIAPGIKKGEYAFLGAGISGSSAAGSRGKAYTFRVRE